MIFAKTFRNDVLLNMVYYRGTWYVTLAAADAEQTLVDSKFPPIFGKGKSVSLRAYDHPDFAKVSVWEATEGVPVIAPITNAASTRDLQGVGYTQVYAVAKPRALAAGSTRRECLFRFGNWCYAGAVDFGVDALNLGDVPDVLPVLQRQQGSLAYMCEIAKFPAEHPFAKPLAAYKSAVDFMTVEMVSAQEDLEKLASQAATAWVDEDSAASFFEMAFEHAPELADMEVIASKTYTAVGIVLHCVWFGGSMFCVLASASEDQPLLDVAFPDVTAKCRGVQVRSYGADAAAEFEDCPHPRRLTVWEGRRAGVPDFDLDMVAAMQEEIMHALSGTSAGSALVAATKAQAVEAVEPAVAEQSAADEADSKVDEPAEEEPTGKQADEADEGAVGSAAAAGSARAAGAGSPARVHASRQAAQAGGVASVSRAPHHLKPLGKVGGAGGRLKPLAALDDAGEAPWDASGQPVLGSKK